MTALEVEAIAAKLSRSNTYQYFMDENHMFDSCDLELHGGTPFELLQQWQKYIDYWSETESKGGMLHDLPKEYVALNEMDKVLVLLAAFPKCRGDEVGELWEKLCEGHGHGDWEVKHEPTG